MVSFFPELMQPCCATSAFYWLCPCLRDWFNVNRKQVYVDSPSVHRDSSADLISSLDTGAAAKPVSAAFCFRVGQGKGIKMLQIQHLSFYLPVSLTSTGRASHPF